MGLVEARVRGVGVGRCGREPGGLAELALSGQEREAALRK